MRRARRDAVLSFVTTRPAPTWYCGGATALPRRQGQQTGVTAWCDCDVPQLAGVALQSNTASSAAFVSVQQINGVIPIVYALPGVGNATYRLTTFGTAGLPGDADCDGNVGLPDLQQVLRSWGDCNDVQSCPGDLTGDGVVNVDDLLRVINQWGASA